MRRRGGDNAAGREAAGSCDLRERIELSVDRTIQMVLALPLNTVGRVIGGQIVRSAASVGANLEESQAVLTRRDYTHKVSLSLREARETLYWMRRIENNGLLPRTRLEQLRMEWDEIVAMLTTTVKNLRKQKAGNET